MSGWFSTWGRGRQAGAHAQLMSGERKAVDLDRLLRMLPRLGTVLYVPVAQYRPWPIARPHARLVAESPLLLPLLHTRSLQSSTQIGTNGPIEWLDCEDGVGQRLARIYLLPDSDYLAWDRLSSLDPAEPVAPLSPLRRWRPGAAILTEFQLRQLAGVALLSCAGYSTLSGIGLRVAGDLATRERVHLGTIARPAPVLDVVTSLS